MSGPKHLWSGDWQRESAAVSDELADRAPAVPPPTRARAPAVPPPTSGPTVSPPARARVRRPVRGRRRGLPRALPIVLAAMVFLAAGALGLNALLDSSGSPAASGASAAIGSSGGPASTTANVPPRPVNWLGMEIETVPPGAAVVVTLGAGSQGEIAGLQPGDEIVQINNRAISGTGDIATAIRGLSAGDVVTIQVSRGSGFYQTEATLAAPPSAYP